MAEHNYPKNDSPDMRKITNPVINNAKSNNTEAGPHLKQGQGTKYNQAVISKGFMLQDARPGHRQQLNLDKNK